MKFLLLLLIATSSFAEETLPAAEQYFSEYPIEYNVGTFCDFADMKMYKLANTVCLWKFTKCGKVTSKFCCWENKKGTFIRKEHVVFTYKYCPRNEKK